MGKIFSDPFKITKDTTVQWFQSRINHKILATNTYLYKIKLIGDPKCTFWNKTDETIEHLLWECEHVKSFLNETISWLIQHGIHITLNEKSFIFGIDPNQKSDINKLVLIEIKYYIYGTMQDAAKATWTSQCYNTDLNFYTKHISTRPFQQGNMKIFKQTGKITITY